MLCASVIECLNKEPTNSTISRLFIYNVCFILLEPTQNCLSTRCFILKFDIYLGSNWKE